MMKDKVKLVIKMSEETYETIKEYTVWTIWAEALLVDLIKNATLLPKGEWLRMSDLSEQEDDRYKCSRCGNVVHHKDKMDLYTFNSWCGRCGSDNRCFESQGEIPRHFSNCEVLVEKRKNGIQPSIYIKTADSVYIVGITPDCNFDITDESNNWDIIDGVPKFINDVENEDYASLCTQRFCLKNHNIGIIECYEKYCPNRTKW